MGHAAGAETFRRIATYCKNLGVEYLTVLRILHGKLEALGGRGAAPSWRLFEKYLHEAIDGDGARPYPASKILGELGPPISPELRALM